MPQREPHVPVVDRVTAFLAALAAAAGLAFELPMMGWAVVWRRWLVSLLLAPLAGLMAIAVVR